MTKGLNVATAILRRCLTVAAVCLACDSAGCAQMGGPAALAPVRQPASATPRRPRPSPPEPGADRLVAAMRRSIELTGEQPWGEVLVGLDRIRNHSHVSASDFDIMRRRLAGVLTAAGRSGRVPLRYVSRAEEPVDYELSGTAYLMTSQGFDLWELYLSLHVPGQEWTVWSADEPVRMLRFPRRGEPQLYLTR